MITFQIRIHYCSLLRLHSASDSGLIFLKPKIFFDKFKSERFISVPVPESEGNTQIVI